MGKKQSRKINETSRRLVDIESKERLASKAIDRLCSRPEMLKEYLESSLSHTFSELLFRLTHEIYEEDKAKKLWDEIIQHKANLDKLIKRDVGILVAALDYLTNVTRELASPKIIDDLRLEEAADMATRDPLTGLYVRQVFDFTLNRMVEEHIRFKRELSLNGRYR